MSLPQARQALLPFGTTALQKGQGAVSFFSVESSRLQCLQTMAAS